MLLRPRRIPRRFNREPSALTRRFVRHRHRRRRAYTFERWKRLLARFQRTSGAMRQSLRRLLITFAVGFTLLIAGLLIFSPLLIVHEIRVPRSSMRIDVEQVQRALAPIFRRHLFFLSSQEIVNLLREAVPDLMAVNIQKRYPSTLVVRLTLDPIIARLSIEEPDAAGGVPATSSGTAVPQGDYLTAQGFYVRYTPAQIRGDPLVPIRVVDWGARPAPWSRLVDPVFLLAIGESEQALLDQFGQETTERTIFLRAQEFHLRTKTVTLWFDLKSSLEEHLQRYRTFLRTIGPAAAKEYIDLRLRDRVVYK